MQSTEYVVNPAGLFAGKTALVTGSTSGIGVAIAEAFAAQGAHVIVTGRNTERGDDVVAAIVAAGGRADFVAADLAEGGSAATALVDATLQLLGRRLDILINNAAYLVGGLPTIDTPEALIDKAFAVSVKAPFLVTAAVVPSMLDNGGGIIVNVGSINGVVGMAGAALYGATKAALHALTDNWAAEFGPRGIRVNTVAPGPTLTAGNAKHADLLAPMMAKVPSRRMTSVSEVADAVLFLAGDGAANIHGATLMVDGGFTTV